uniref:Spatacsin C-terminal domain-containing protein n=1 Tax=Knipowitschia caucasica TaxID=637954 RepID=A0AAV2KZZ4_KNICA
MTSSDGLEVTVIPENPLGPRVAEIQDAALAPGASLLACVGLHGGLEVWDPGDREARPVRVQGRFKEFQWDQGTDRTLRDQESSGPTPGPRRVFKLVAVGSELELKLVEVSVGPGSISLLPVCEATAEDLLQKIREKDQSVSELQSLHVLSWSSACGCVLVNSEWILRLQLQQTEQQLNVESCFRIQPEDRRSETVVHHCVCSETLFCVTASGFISVLSLSDGSVLASVDLPRYLDSGLQEEDWSPPSSLSPPASFLLLQVSSDLNTAVAFTDAHTATAIDLNHYFRSVSSLIHSSQRLPPPAACEPLQVGAAGGGSRWRREPLEEGAAGGGSRWRREPLEEGAAGGGSRWRWEPLEVGAAGGGSHWRREPLEEGAAGGGSRWRWEPVEVGAAGGGSRWRREPLEVGAAGGGSRWRREPLEEGAAGGGSRWRREPLEEGAAGGGSRWRWEPLEEGAAGGGSRWRREPLEEGAAVITKQQKLLRGQLRCVASPRRPPLQPQLRDPDSVASSSFCLSALGLDLNSDRSWESRLVSMYSEARDGSPARSSPAASCWWSALPHLSSHHAPVPAFTPLPHGGLTHSFSLPEACSPRILTVSEFSAVVTAVAPGNARTTIALWEFESRKVSCHTAEGEAAPVQLCGERQDMLLLKESGLVQVLFSVSQEDLLSRLMLFGSAATVDAVCNLNSWGRCSIPIHSLQAGLKNRQLDTVDFYLKSKENLLKSKEDLLSPSEDTGTTGTTGITGTNLTERVQLLCPALDLLCCAVTDSNSEAQSRQFSEQLLHITLSFLHTQIQDLLSERPGEGPGDSADVQSCVEVLDQYLTQLRGFMKRFPWSNTRDQSNRDQTSKDDWDHLSTEEVVRASVLINQIPRAQAVLRRRGQSEHRLEVLKGVGLQQVYSSLQDRDLPTAMALLTNMGFSVKEEFHRICQFTDDKDLREFVVEELMRRNYFTADEAKSLSFIREMERLCSLPVAQSSSKSPAPRLLHMVHAADTGEVLKDLMAQPGFGDSNLWVNVRLDWVKNWEQGSQTRILLSRLKHTELPSCDSSVLWRYLTSLHQEQLVEQWVQSWGASQWPELRPEELHQSTSCSSYMREHILDQLARRGVFIPEELCDLERLLWRVAQSEGVMSQSSLLQVYRASQGLDFHTVFIRFCLDRGLKYLLYSYLQHHSLTPRNCPALCNQDLFVSHPWFEMLVRIQEITTDLSDPGLVFQASLTSAQVLLPGSQAALSSLLLEGHTQLALASIMFAPGGIDQVLSQGSGSETAVDPQLLKMALSPYPKLKAALFPPAARGSSPQDVSVYLLMQSLHPLDPSKLFSWQTTNSLNCTETSELPHFSSPALVSKFALVENLDFLYFLRHGRPSVAYATFLVQHLNSCSDVQLLLQKAWMQVYRLAVSLFTSPSVGAAVVCFCELLGLCSLQVRVDLRVLNSVLQHLSREDTRTSGTTSKEHLQTLVSTGLRLVEAEPGAAEELIGLLEAAVCDSLEQRGVGRCSYEAALEWSLAVQFCQSHGLSLSSVFLSHCAQDGHFIHFLLFIQMHSFPPQQVRSLVSEFSPTLASHLRLAFQDLQLLSPGARAGEEQAQEPTPEDQGTLSSERPKELFQVLLQSQNEACTCRFLLQEALVQHCPTLAILAACDQAAERLSCLCVWILSSVDQSTVSEATSHLDVAPQHHHWTLHDLSIIWRTLLGRGQVSPLLRGFQLFQRDCPLVLVLRMFQLCCDYRDFSEAKAKLLDFQKTLITLRGSVPAPPGGLPLQWVESQASVLLLTILQRCSSQFDLHRLLQLLADVNKLLKSSGPDFRKLSQLSGLLQGSDVSLSPRLLQCTSPSDQQEELQIIVDQLQSRGRYSQAREVSQLAGLPLHRLLLRQLEQELNSLREKPQWKRLKTRLNFWKKSHVQLQTDSIDPESAALFFLSQSQPLSPDPTELSSQSQTLTPALSALSQDHRLLLDTQEKCLLVSLASHWLSRLSPAPVSRLEELEKQLWLSRVKHYLLIADMERESVFSVPQTVSSEQNSYEALMKEFSFSNISSLNTAACLSLDGFPNTDSSPLGLTPAEGEVLSSLLGQILDQGSIHEASRVCRYFSLFHKDVWLVLRCRALASGEVSPDQRDQELRNQEQDQQQTDQEKDQEPKTGETSSEQRTGMTSSASFSSLSSFVVCPLPEDEVSTELQKLVNQSRHGNSYCKQVLSLYHLSKELQVSFAQVCSEDPVSVLQQLLILDQPERFRRAHTFIRAQGLTPEAVAQLVSSALLSSMLSSTQELGPERQVFRPTEGRDSLLQLLKLCEDPNLVGTKLLESITSVPLSDLNCMVELLVVAHDCFSFTCNMEGIVRVLQAARHLSHAHLAPAEKYGLLVRLLTGVGRYNEMTYIFDLLHQNHRFEMLLRKKMDIDRGQSSSLKTALLDYLKRCLPGDSEKHNMVALCFSMRREIGENHETAARTLLKMIESQDWVVSPDLKSSLEKVLGLLKDAAESYTKDSCVRQASRCVKMAKLVSLQLHFLKQGQNLRIINLRPAEVTPAAVSLPHCYQVCVLAEAYSCSPDWAEVLFHRVVLKGDFSFLDEFKRHRTLSTALLEEIIRKLDSAPPHPSAHVKKLLSHCEDVYSRYRLAYELKMFDVTQSLLQDKTTACYLHDRLAR